MISFFESMNIDSLASTHPIILDVQTKDEIRKFRVSLVGLPNCGKSSLYLFLF